MYTISDLRNIVQKKLLFIKIASLNLPDAFDSHKISVCAALVSVIYKLSVSVYQTVRRWTPNRSIWSTECFSVFHWIILVCSENVVNYIKLAGYRAENFRFGNNETGNRASVLSKNNPRSDLQLRLRTSSACRLYSRPVCLQLPLIQIYAVIFSSENKIRSDASAL